MFDDTPQIPLPPAGRRPRIQRVLCLGLLPLFVLPALIGLVGTLTGSEPATSVGVSAVPGMPSDTPAPAGLRQATTSTTEATTTTAAPTTTTTPLTTTTPPTTTEAPTTTVAPTTNAVPAAAKAVPTTQAPAPPTTAAAPPPTAPPAPAPVRSDRGKATWYRWKAGNCAHNTLPKGTRVTVTAVATGKSTTCVVGDRGAFQRPTIIDLDATVFAQIAPLGAGRIDVVISW
ncbi:MAG: hypothetical protein KDB02_15340 [Acidimicrobiales bacterium]|nr:hypothetical protein [Acidimicrobiales bacterium]